MIYGLGTIEPRYLYYTVLGPFYTKIFTDTNYYGIVTELNAVMVVLVVILGYGMKTGVFRFIQNSNEAAKVYSTAHVSLLVSSLLFVIPVNIFITPFSALMNYKYNFY